MSFTVGTKDFRRALQSVLPHVSRDDELPMLNRARCFVDVDNVTVAGTDRYTAALAIASVWDIDTMSPVVGSLDLSLTDIAKILAVFKAGKDKDDDDAPAFQLRIELRACADDALVLRITDASGLIDGEHLEIPTSPPVDNFPLLRELIATYLAEPSSTLDTFGVSGTLIGRLQKAATVYDELLVLSRAGTRDTSPILARCGESFLGAVMPIRFPDEEKAKHDGWLHSWSRRLPPPRGTVDLATAVGVVAESTGVEVVADSGPRASLVEAAREVITMQFGSASMLQRRLRVGFAKAAHYLDELEKRGIVGPKPEGAAARKVLIPSWQLQETLDELAKEETDDDE